MEEKNNTQSISKRILVLSALILLIGTMFYFFIDGSWLECIFAHLGALGLISMLGYFSGKIAENKGYKFLRSYFLSVSISISSGISLAFLWPVITENNHIPCGGSIALVVSFLILIFQSAIKRTNK